MSQPLAIQIDVPKTHPGLDRLCKAASQLPNVSIEQQDGVIYKKQSLIKPGVIEEFLDALAAIIGEERVSDVEEQLGIRGPLNTAEQIDLLGILSNVTSALPIAALAQLLPTR